MIEREECWRRVVRVDVECRENVFVHSDRFLVLNVVRVLDGGRVGERGRMRRRDERMVRGG